MKNLAVGIGCVLLSAVAISGWQSTFAKKSTQNQTAEQVKRSAQDNQTPSSSTSIDAAAASLTQEVVQESQLIATGRCTNLQSKWINERTLVTLATIEVGETLKGTAQPTITVVLPGGVDANRRIPVAVKYPGSPQIARDEEVFLFLRAQEEQVPNGFSVTRYADGKFSIGEGSNGEKFVSRDRVNRATQPEARITGQNDSSAVATKPKNAISIEKFKEQVRDLLQ